jgi:hypothetical protein
MSFTLFVFASHLSVSCELGPGRLLEHLHECCRPEEQSAGLQGRRAVCPTPQDPAVDEVST